MKNFTSMVIILAWMAVLVNKAEVEDFTKMRFPNVTQDMPSYFQRLYERWSEDSTCTGQTVKCSQGEVRRGGRSRFRIKAKIPNIIRSNLLKVDIRMELHNISRWRQKGKSSYKAVIVPKDPQILNDSQVMQDIVVKEFFLDMSFNFTNVLLSSLEHGKEFVNILLNLRRGSRPVKISKRAVVKAFLIVHEVDHKCHRNTLNITTQITNSILFKKKSPMGLVRSNRGSFMGTCALKKWKVSITDIKWENFVIYPHEIDAYRCAGACSFPVRGVDITDHAFLKLSAYMANRDIEPRLPCCVPKSLAPIPMITSDHKTSGFVFVLMPNLVAKSCACL